jgi:hypothetical protein
LPLPQVRAAGDEAYDALAGIEEEKIKMTVYNPGLESDRCAAHRHLLSIVFLFCFVFLFFVVNIKHTPAFP